MLLINVILCWLACRKIEGLKLLERVTFKLGWNKSTGLVCRLHMFIDIAESHVNSAHWKATVGWYQVTTEKITIWTKSKATTNKTPNREAPSLNFLGSC